MKTSTQKFDISILGAGWLGSALAEHFVTQGKSVQLATRSAQRYQNLQERFQTSLNLHLHQFDFEKEVPAEFLHADVLIINIPNKNIDAFKSFARNIEQSPIHKVLFTSSTSVYNNVNRVVTEDSGDENINHPLYQIEQTLLTLKSKRVTIVRLAGLVGNGRHPGKWFMQRPLTQPQAPINLIHRDDCVGIINAILQQNAWGEIFNACGSLHPSKGEYYSYMRSQVSEVPIEFDESDCLSYKIVSNNKVKKVLNYSFVNEDYFAF